MLLLSKLVTKVVGVVQPGQDYDAWSSLHYQHKLLEIIFWLKVLILKLTLSFPIFSIKNQPFMGNMFDIG